MKNLDIAREIVKSDLPWMDIRNMLDMKFRRLQEGKPVFVIDGYVLKYSLLIGPLILPPFPAVETELIKYDPSDKSFCWVIQPLCGYATEDEKMDFMVSYACPGYDLHRGNIGTYNDKVVAFDW